MSSCQKIRDKFTNFASRYSDLKPSTSVSSKSISIEKAEIEDFIAWLNQNIQATRQQVKLYVSQKTFEAPKLDALAKKISTFQGKIMVSWTHVSNVHDQIFQNRKQYFDDRNALLTKQNKLTRQLKKLEEESFIFSVPGKFPEAYRKTIDELIRRKVFNLSS